MPEATKREEVRQVILDYLEVCFKVSAIDCTSWDDDGPQQGAIPTYRFSVSDRRGSRTLRLTREALERLCEFNGPQAIVDWLETKQVAEMLEKETDTTLTTHDLSPGRGMSQDLALTSRQREVLGLIVEGLSTKEIAGNLGVAVKTVEAHRSALVKRLGVRNVAGLVREALRLDLITHRS